MSIQSYVNVRVFEIVEPGAMTLVAGVDTGSQLDTAIFEGRAWGLFAGESAELIEGNMELIRDPANSVLPEITNTSLGNIFGDIWGSPSVFVGEYIVVALSYPPPQQIVELTLGSSFGDDGYIDVVATYEPIGDPIHLLMGMSPTNPILDSPLEYFWTDLVGVTQ